MLIDAGCTLACHLWVVCIICEYCHHWEVRGGQAAVCGQPLLFVLLGHHLQALGAGFSFVFMCAGSLFVGAGASFVGGGLMFIGGVWLLKGFLVLLLIVDVAEAVATGSYLCVQKARGYGSGHGHWR